MVKVQDITLKPFSILGRIEGGETVCQAGTRGQHIALSVSSAGSKGVKLSHSHPLPPGHDAFSILGRIEGGETYLFSQPPTPFRTFSILGRIEGGETTLQRRGTYKEVCLSVSSAGSKGVKPCPRQVSRNSLSAFQYPRPDRRG